MAAVTAVGRRAVAAVSRYTSGRSLMRWRSAGKSDRHESTPLTSAGRCDGAAATSPARLCRNSLRDADKALSACDVCHKYNVTYAIDEIKCRLAYLPRA